MRPNLSFFLLLPFFLFTLILFSCSKGGTPAPNPVGGSTPPPPPPPAGGTTTGGPTITAISPLNPYQGDIVTLTGTGFDPDPTKDTVLIGAKVLFNGQYYFSVGKIDDSHGVGNAKTTIISATATEIKFRTDSTMYIFGGQNAKWAIQVSVPSKSVFTGDTLNLKIIPFLSGCDHYDPYPLICYGYPIFAGDSLFLHGRGLYPPVTITVDGKPIDNYYYFGVPSITDVGEGYLHGFINIDFFGTTTPAGNCSSATVMKEVKVVNADGRVARLPQTPFFPGPNSQIIEMYMDQPIYKKSESNNGLLTLRGYAIRNFKLVVKGIDQADNSVFTETLAGHDGDLVGTFTQAIDLLALPDPKSSAGAIYTVQMQLDNGAFASGARFTLYK
jgi:hypothetical protein